MFAEFRIKVKDPQNLSAFKVPLSDAWNSAGEPIALTNGSYIIEEGSQQEVNFCSGNGKEIRMTLLNSNENLAVILTGMEDHDLKPRFNHGNEKWSRFEVNSQRQPCNPDTSVSHLNTTSVDCLILAPKPITDFNQESSIMAQAFINIFKPELSLRHARNADIEIEVLADRPFAVR
ncbi:MAG TPA: hypothetical protein VF828_01120 [Patescibacteria group bacterium]